MSLTERQKSLFSLLINEEDYIAVHEIAEKLGVSSRTVYYDLDKIEKTILYQGFELIRQPGLGIKLDSVKGINKSNEPNKIDFRNRKEEIFARLVIENRTVTIDKLSKEYYISPSSIVKDLNEIEDNIKKFPNLIMIRNNQGTRIIGKENDIQELLQEFNNNLLKSIGPNSNVEDYSELLSKYYGSDVVSAVMNIEKDLASYNLKIKAPYYKYNLISVLTILVYRLSKGHHINNSEVESHIAGKSIYSMDNYMIAWELLTKMSERLNFKFSESDIYLLAKQLQGNRLKTQNQSMKNLECHEKISKRIIKNMSVAIDEDLSEDKVLEKNLTMHIYHMIYRLKNNINISNPLLPQITKDFRLMYDIVWILMDEECEKIGVNVTEDEVGFLLLHFQTALDRIEKSRMIYVVSHESYISHDFTVNRIRKVVSSLDVVKIVTPEQFISTNLEHIDFVISTVVIDVLNIPYVLVSPMITDEDLLVVSKKYQNMLKDNENNENYFFTEFTYNQFIYCNRNAKSKEEILKVMLDDLVREEFVKENYVDTVLIRESEGKTSIGKGIAVPHGSMKYVNKTVISVWLNQHPIKWDTEYVELVFLYAIAQDDLKHSKKIIQSLLDFGNKKDKIIFKNKEMDEKTIKNYLLGGINDK